ncbi:histone-fold-containing protein [Linderina pennispora]|uniref:Histone-fold-containing protein n=1 Tax=Linderina pennispora TaxID=61395 RepID=A0A1Y1WK01_9FUNG|nr:histone-fold-containing protein [Linderina pennispora]ORX73658.1 histone-fold-containing protein [Linderina pennispora]
MVTFESHSQPGVSTLPAARVRRIIKEDKDIFACGADSIFLVSRATEYFIDSLVREGYEFARFDKRKTVQYKDMAKAVQSIEQYDFLSDIIPPTVTLKKTSAAADKDSNE